MLTTIIRGAHIITILGALGTNAGLLPLGATRIRLARLFAVAGVVAALVGMSVRWWVTGHPPMFGTLENTWLCGTVLLGVFIWADLLGGRLREFAPLLPPWSAVILAWGLRFRFEPLPVTISEQSIIVDLHVALAWTAFAALLWAGTISLVGLVRRREPISRDVDRLVMRLVSYGYVFLTAMILVGGTYLFVLFGKFWRWEPVGILALVTWIGYSILLHGWLLQGWRGARLAWASASLLVPLLLLFWLWSVFPGTYHYFDIPLLLPY
jgi:ABC-type transport system involved in cytochrome c biogenesis permease subunit